MTCPARRSAMPAGGPGHARPGDPSAMTRSASARRRVSNGAGPARWTRSSPNATGSPAMRRPATHHDDEISPQVRAGPPRPTRNRFRRSRFCLERQLIGGRHVTVAAIGCLLHIAHRGERHVIAGEGSRSVAIMSSNFFRVAAAAALSASKRTSQSGRCSDRT